MKQGIEIYFGNDLESTVKSVSSYTIADNYTLIAYSGGTASKTTVASGGAMKVSGGTATKTTVKSNGFMLVESGSVSGITVRAGGLLQLTGEASDIDVMSSGEALVNSGGIADDLTLYVNGTVTVNQGGVIRNSIQRNGSILLSSGSAEDITVYSGTLTVGNGSVASRISLELDGASLTVSSGGTLLDSICDGAEIIAESGSVIRNTTVTGYEAEDPFGESDSQKFIGKMTLRSGAIHQGTLAITARGELIAESGSVIDFTVSETTPGAPALIDNFAGITGSPDYTLTVKPDQQTGIYILAENAATFSGIITVKNTVGTEFGTLSAGETKNFNGREYALTLDSDTLSLTINSAVLYTIAGNFTGTGSAFQLMGDGTACIRTSDAKTMLAGTVDPVTWEIVGSGDFNGAGHDGLLWLEKATGNVYMQYDMTTLSEITGKTNCLGTATDGYTLKSAGDFTGNGIAGALLQGPAFGDASVSLNYGLPVWARNDDGSTFNGWLGALVNTWQKGDPLKGDLNDPVSINTNNYQYEVIGVGDFNGDGVDDVMLQNTMPGVVTQGGVDYTITGSGDVFTFLTGEKAAIIAGADPTVCYAGCATDGWKILGFGDFNNDGIDDALLSDGIGLAGWKLANGQRQSNFWFGNLNSDQEFAGIADFNNDGTDDLLIRTLSTGDLNAWTINNGDVTGVLAIK